MEIVQLIFYKLDYLFQKNQGKNFLCKKAKKHFLLLLYLYEKTPPFPMEKKHLFLDFLDCAKFLHTKMMLLLMRKTIVQRLFKN
jgi:hypothetical protein